MIGDKGPRRGTAGNHLQHRRFRLDKIAIHQVAAHALDDFRAHLESVAGLLVDDQIHIALAVTGFGIGEALVLLRQRPQGLGQQHILIHGHIQIALAGFAQGAAHPDDIAQIPMLRFLLHFLGGIDLDTAGHVLQHLEGFAIQHQAAGHSHLQVHLLQLFLALLAVAGLQFGGQRIAAKGIGKGLAIIPQGRQFLTTLGNQAILFLSCSLQLFLSVGSLFVGHHLPWGLGYRPAFKEASIN